MTNSDLNSKFNSNLGVVGSILVFLLGLLFFIVVLLHTDTTVPSVVVLTICSKTRNSSLCQSVLEPVGSTDALILANYTLSLAHISATEGRRYARQLAAKTANPHLKKRYSECSRRFDFAVKGIENGIQSLAEGSYSPFKKPPSEPSALPKKAKDLGDICDIAVSMSNILVGDDY